MGIRTYRIGSARKRGEGLRLGTVRFLPRGVKKKDYGKLDLFDVWMPILAPSRKLLAWARGREWDTNTRRTFFARYEREVLGKSESREVVSLIAQLGRRTSISLGCYCADERLCHRSMLIKIVRDATID